MRHLYAILFLGLSLALFTPTPLLAEQSCLKRHGANTSQEVQQALDNWLAAISSGNSDMVGHLYEDDAVLLPTMSNKVANTPELRKAYFDKFVAHPDLKGVIDEEHIRVYGPIAINSGLYTFTFTKDGESISIPARFSFVYRETCYGWKIIDHHSSKLPQE